MGRRGGRVVRREAHNLEARVQIPVPQSEDQPPLVGGFGFRFARDLQGITKMQTALHFCEPGPRRRSEFLPQAGRATGEQKSRSRRALDKYHRDVVFVV